MAKNRQSRWRLLRAVPIREWPAVVAAVGVAALAEIELRVSKLPSTARRLGVPLAVQRPGLAAPTGPETAAALEPSPYQPRLPNWAKLRLRAVHRVMRHWPFGDTCLRQALVAGQRLRKLHPVLQVGVAKDDGVVKAHAWLQIDGISLDPAAPSSYAVVQSVTSARR
jgi:hypothetical protein